MKDGITFWYHCGKHDSMRKGGKKILLSDSFVKPYVKVEGLPDLLLRYERDKNSMNLVQMEIIAFLNLSSRGSYYFTIVKVWMMIICFCWIIIMNPDIWEPWLISNWNKSSFSSDPVNGFLVKGPSPQIYTVSHV